MASKSDYQLASVAFGFTLGFGFLTVWEALKQTRRSRNPRRNVFIYMIWGEIVANLAIAIVGWLFLDGVIGATVPVLFVILALWVFEIQLLMQIIINRIAVIAERPETISRIKWGTVAIISVINIMVFIIWIPAHLTPPPIHSLVTVNKYWDPMSKVLILLVDAGLNWNFLRGVNQRLVKEHGLVKYKPLVSFNAKLMVVSVAMDAMLIGLMWLPNEVVYIQFHPVAYMVKLNIEMSMASLILKLARSSYGESYHHSLSSSHENTHHRHGDPRNGTNRDRDIALKSFNRAVVRANSGDSDSDLTGPAENGINRRLEFEVTVHQATPREKRSMSEGSDRKVFINTEDEDSLTSNPGHPSTVR
ncbi:hypothetical protein F5X96DRAFT_622219 [Biscogniauxia mediterranea]|nr:hypothetical protein F5X96DRAFT_622219 [Biscogniauxia mediterranea]